jgi:hypothetical protein
MVSTPCCSEIGPFSKEAIPPGSRCAIPVLLKVAPILQAEKKRVGFLLQTDSKECPNWTYTLSAMVFPAWEVRVSADSTRTLPIGRSGRQVMRITGRRVGTEGNTLPTRVEAESPLVARFLGDSREETESAGVTSRTRDVEIILPTSSKPGAHRNSIRFRWPEGLTQEHLVLWEVVPAVRASPSRLVVKLSERDVTHTVVLRISDDRPFHVSHIGPPRLVVSSEFDDEASLAHTLKVRIDPRLASQESNPQITIKTDVADQPTVSVSIVVLSPESLKP